MDKNGDFAPLNV